MKSGNQTKLVIVLCLLTVFSLLWARPFIFSYHHEASLSGNEILHSRAVADIPGDTDTLIMPPKDRPLTLLAYIWPPFNYKLDDNTWGGADTEIAEQVLKRMGYSVQYKHLPFKRILDEMKKGHYAAMLPCVIGGGREEYMLFSEPVSSIYSVLWKKKEDTFTWDNYEQLNGRTIGASYYHYGAGFLEAGNNGVFKLDMVATKFPELVHFNKLIDGKIDMFICEVSVGLYIKSLYKPKFDQVDYCLKGVGPRRFFSFPVSRKYFDLHGYDADRFIALFNKELEKFSQQGMRKKIFEYYGMPVALDSKGRVLLTDQESDS